MAPDKPRPPSPIANLAPRAREATERITPLIEEASSWLEGEQDPQTASRDENGELVFIRPQKLYELLISALHTSQEYFGTRSLTYSQLEKLSERSSNLTNEAILSKYVGILKAVEKSIYSGTVLGSINDQGTPDAIIETIIKVLTNFDSGAQRILVRPRKEKSGKNYEIDDEYDVQDLLYSILKPLIPDLDCENPTPKIAGDSGRVDLCSNQSKLIIEIKYGKNQSRSANLAMECRERIILYKDYPNLKWMFFFVYDPKRFIPDRHNFQKDLSTTNFSWGNVSFNVKAIITP